MMPRMETKKTGKRNKINRKSKRNTLFLHEGALYVSSASGIDRQLHLFVLLHRLFVCQVCMIILISISLLPGREVFLLCSFDPTRCICNKINKDTRVELTLYILEGFGSLLFVLFWCSGFITIYSYTRTLVQSTI